jgi:hypothetical protein
VDELTDDHEATVEQMSTDHAATVEKHAVTVVRWCRLKRLEISDESARSQR